MIYAIIFVVIFAVLFLVIPKKAAIGFGIGGVIVLLVVGLIYWNDQQEQQLLDSVPVEMAYDPDTCNEQAPLFYRITNQSGERVYRVYFRYTAYRQGYSNPVSKSYSNDVTENKIIESGATHIQCIPLPEFNQPVPLNELEFRVEYKRVWQNSPVL